MMARLTVFRIRRLMITRSAESLSRVKTLRPWLMQRFIADLRDLNDALKHTELDGHYWVWSGLLLGWARDGAVLPHDCLDADFAVANRDFQRLVAAVPAMVQGRLPVGSPLRQQRRPSHGADVPSPWCPLRVLPDVSGRRAPSLQHVQH